MMLNCQRHALPSNEGCCSPLIAPQASLSNTHSVMSSLLNPLMVHLRLPREGANAVATAKRESSDGEGARTDSSSSGANSVKRERDDDGRERVVKQRKPTYAVRKDERDALLQEMRELEARVGLLRRQVGMPSLGEYATMQQKLYDNRRLGEARRNQAVALCGTHSILSQHLREEFASPLKMYVRLGHDLSERKDQLLAIRSEKLSLAYEFMQHHSIGLPADVPWRRDESWTTPEGDYRIIHSDVTHFEAATSVKQAYDALIFYLSNMEISISEELGHLTLREDINSVDTSSTHNRLVSSTKQGHLVEMNSVAFGEYYPHFDPLHGQEFALIAIESVDEDELYPYRPQERLRKNVTAAITLAMCPRPSSRAGEFKSVVVMRRCAFGSMLKPHFPMSPAAFEDLRLSMGCWGELMVKVVHDQLRTSTKQLDG